MENLAINEDFTTVEEEIPFDYEDRYVWIKKTDCKFEGEYVVVAESAIPSAECSLLPDDWLAD